MNTFIILLRGINVGGHKKIPMAELRQLLTNSGFSNVKTYIQSGNIILQSSVLDKSKIERIIQKQISDHFGFDVPVIAKTSVELIRIFDAYPFSKVKKEQSYFVILRDIPQPELVKKASEKTFDNEEFVIIEDCLYFHSSKGYGRSKFNMNAFEKILKVKATSRNYKTMLKLIAMSSENEKDH
ncbi:DUF1697 domain-containing protein [Psychroserpens sp.]|uniref:DUF1697 domain-containing protein n=1 Tax=Psychroserpens sp. TaxID=2020870 RepID=UPI00385BD21D